MDISSAVEDDDLLVKTAETIQQMTEVFRAREADNNAKIFYSRLICLFSTLQYREEDTHRAPSLNADLINKTLQHLGSLVEIHSQIAGNRLCLQFLNSIWNNIKNQNDDIKYGFASRCLKLVTSEDHCMEVIADLEICANELDEEPQPSKQRPWRQPRQHKRDPTDPYESSDVREPSSIWTRAKSAFTALSSCTACSCSNQHMFELELSTHRKSPKKDNKPDNSVSRPGRKRPHDGNVVEEPSFDILLSMKENWHQILVQVKSDVKDDAEPSLRRRRSNKPEKVDKLCQAVSSTVPDYTQRLVLTLEDDHLLHHGFEKRCFRIENATRPIPLTEILEQPHALSDKVRRMLSLIIAYTVFHLCGTSWLQPGWSSETINFFQSDSGDIPLWPFIQTTLSGSATPDSPCSDDDYYGNMGRDSLHRFPALVALAVVLMEVHFDKPFKTLAEEYNIDWHKRSCIKCIDVEQMFYGYNEKNQGCRPEIPGDSPLGGIIDDCLNAELWEDNNNNALDVGVARSKMYKRVVRPLEKHLEYGFSWISLDEIDKHAKTLGLPKPNQVIINHVATVSLQYRRQTPSPPLESNVTTQQTTPNPDPVDQNPWSLDNGTDNISNEKAKMCQKWKSDFDRVYKKFGEVPNDSSFQSVKIAILDTGLDREHSSIMGSIKAMRNFYDPHQTSDDFFNGHGTFVTGLILDYAPDAEIYIAKVTNENKVPDARAVEKAINYAVDHWKVDIISMSLGWNSFDSEGFSAINDAIRNASRNDVLMFAAASNNGGQRGRSYPASDSRVLCIHSTDTYGNRSAFSATAKVETKNIATVGESVKSAGSKRLSDGTTQYIKEWRSGTSYSTAIASGIAAFLLQYTRLHLDDERMLVLKQKEKMEALLARCAEYEQGYKPRDNYYYVRLSLEKGTLFGGGDVKSEILKVLAAP